MPVSATWPSAPRVFPTHSDLLEVVYADVINAIQVEVTALETTVGYNPHLSAQGYGAGTAPTVAGRLAAFESDMVNRVGVLERYTRNASESAFLGTTVSISSSTSWSSLMLTQVDQTTTANQIGPSAIFDNSAGFSRFLATAPDQTAYSVSSTITWAAIPTGSPAGRRGVQIVGSDGRIYARKRQQASVGSTDPDVMSVHWTGVLPTAAPFYSLSLQVYNDSGQALILSQDTITTPSRTDFTRIPG